MNGASDFSQLGGWLGVDEAQGFLAAQHPGLSQAAPGLIGDEADGQPILLYKAFQDVLGAVPEYPAQEIGDCVSFGHAHGLDLLQCVEIALGEPSEFRETATEFIYATSREVGGLLGRGDGSYGSAAVTAMQRMGICTREHLASVGPYSGRTAKAWGHRGAPAEFKALAESFRLGAAAKVTTWAELVAAVTNGFPVTICSNQGFTMNRDSQGFCQARGAWAHCMLIGGLRFDRPGACILQSWGPTNPSGPTALGQPSFSFWADRPVVERILRQGDSWALSKAPEFAERELPAHWSYSSAA